MAMVTTQEQVIVKLTADNRKLKQQLGVATKEVNKTAAVMKKALLSVTAVISAGAFVRGVNQSIVALDKLNKTALKLGTTTEQLSSLGFAAERSGVEVRTFEMAMQRMTRRVSEAAADTGEAKAAIQELGIEATVLNNLTLEDKMQVLADAFVSVKSKTDRLRLAFKLFDSEGAQLVTMLEGGGNELKRLQRISDETGNTVETKLADSASKATDSMTNFEAATKGMTNHLLSSFLPTLNKAYFAILDFFDISRQKGLKELQDKADGLRESIAGLEKEIKGDSFWSGIANTNVARTNLALLNTELKDVVGEIESYKARNQEPLITDDTINSTAAFTTALEALKTSFLPFQAMGDEYVVNFQLLEEAFAKGAISAKEFEMATANMQTALIDASDAASLTGDEIKYNFNGLNQGFRNAMDGAFSFADTMKAVAKDVVAQLFDIYITQMLVASAMKMFSGFSASSSPSGLPAGADYSSLPKLSFAGGGYTGDGSRSGGVDGIGGFPAILHPNETVVDHESGGGVGATVNVYNYGNDDVSVQEDEAGQIDIIINKIASDITRGTGPIGTSMESRYSLSKS